MKKQLLLAVLATGLAIGPVQQMQAGPELYGCGAALAEGFGQVISCAACLPVFFASLVFACVPWGVYWTNRAALDYAPCHSCRVTSGIGTACAIGSIVALGLPLIALFCCGSLVAAGPVGFLVGIGLFLVSVVSLFPVFGCRECKQARKLARERKKQEKSVAKHHTA